mmetsp:Transcript_60655/g.179868  ORF Transcript_60655/g.179868 Transcript_60655/m.179868 type:complete len:95 (-) Transcript_60655:140-424(-)
MPSPRRVAHEMEYRNRNDLIGTTYHFACFTSTIAMSTQQLEEYIIHSCCFFNIEHTTCTDTRKTHYPALLSLSLFCAGSLKSSLKSRNAFPLRL